MVYGVLGGPKGAYKERIKLVLKWTLEVLQVQQQRDTENIQSVK